MKERPIIFSAPMVKAILSGTKSQTRRVMKTKLWYSIEERDDGTHWPWMYDGDRDADHWMPCPYGKTGEKLWVREAWTRKLNQLSETHMNREFVYRADAETEDGQKWKPSIHMPRAGSRITLEITNVRLQRLQEISEEEAVAEGVDCKEAYRTLWQSIHGPGSWAANSWVWVIEFTRVKPWVTP